VAEFTICLVVVVAPPRVVERLVLVVLGVVEPLEAVLVAILREHLARQTLVAAAVQAIAQLAATAVAV